MAVLLIGCGVVSPDFDRIVAMQIESRDRSIVVGETLQLVARAVNAAGDVVDSVVVGWQIVDVDSGQIGFTLDTATGIVTGTHPGAGRVQAYLAALRSNPITITVVQDSSFLVPQPIARRRRRHGSHS